MSNLQFTFNHNNVRIIDQEGQVWFLLDDVSKALGYKRNPDAARVLDDDEKGVHTVHTPGGKQRMTTVSESGVYHLIFKSRKPDAQRFRKWVTSEVLPAIRQHGHYTATLTPGQKSELKRIVEMVHHESGAHFGSIWKRINNYARVPSYHEIPASKFADVKAFIQQSWSLDDLETVEISKTELRLLAEVALTAQQNMAIARLNIGALHSGLSNESSRIQSVVAQLQQRGALSADSGLWPDEDAPSTAALKDNAPRGVTYMDGSRYCVAL